MQAFLQQQTSTSTLNYTNTSNAFKTYTDLPDLKKRLQLIGFPLPVISNALEKKDEYLLNSNPDLNALFCVPFYLQNYHPKFKDYLAEMLVLTFFSIGINNITLTKEQEQTLEKVFNYVFKNDESQMNDNVINSFKTIFNNFVPLTSFPTSIENPLSYSQLEENLSNSFYNSSFKSGAKEDKRPKFPHFFCSIEFFKLICIKIQQATTLLSNTTGQDWNATFNESNFSIFLSNQGIDLSNFFKFSNSERDDEEIYALSEYRWMTLLRNNKSLLKDIVNNTNLPEDLKNKLIDSINKGTLDHNLTLFFNFFGAAATPFLLGVIADYCFIYQIKSNINDGVFKFSDESLQNWKNFLDVYLQLQDKSSKLDVAKIKQLLNNDFFVQNNLELLEIRNKLNGGGALRDEDLYIVKHHLKKFLPSFAIFSTASGERFTTAAEEQMLKAFNDYVSTNPHKVLELIGIKVEKNVMDSAFKEISPYGFFDYWVYYISTGTEKQRGNLRAVSSRYSIDSFLKDYFALSKNDPSIFYTLQQKRVVFGDISSLSQLPTKEEQKDFLIKIGYVDKNGIVQYGDGKQTVLEILQDGGKPIYFVEDESVLPTLNQIFFKESKLKDNTEEVMKKLRTFSAFSVGQEVTEFKIQPTNNSQITIVPQNYLLSVVTNNNNSLDIFKQHSPTHSSPTTIFVTPIRNENDSQKPERTIVGNTSSVINSPYLLDQRPPSISYSDTTIFVNFFNSDAVLVLNSNKKSQPPFSDSNYVYPSSTLPSGIPGYVPTKKAIEVVPISSQPTISTKVYGGVYFDNQPSKKHGAKLLINGNELTEEETKVLSPNYVLVGWKERDFYLYNKTEDKFERIYIKVGESFIPLSKDKLDKIINANPNTKISLEFYIGDNKSNAGNFFISKDKDGNYSFEPENIKNNNLANYVSTTIPTTPEGYNSALHVNISETALNSFKDNLSSKRKIELGLADIIKIKYDNMLFDGVNLENNLAVITEKHKLIHICDYDPSNKKIIGVNEEGIKKFLESQNIR